MPAKDSTPPSTEPKSGKGAPTPSRAEREAARKQPLVPTDRRAAARASRSKLAEERAQARLGMANGDERYLTARDRGPQRRFVRDLVDARLNIGEFMLPLMFIVIIIGMFNDQNLAVISYVLLWGYLGLVIIDSVILGFIIKRRIEKKFGAGTMQKGTRWYASMRAIQFRGIRLPKPAVKRFASID
ncbi:MAG: DUF3043 domain-containing protein [Agromyces sp.]